MGVLEDLDRAREAYERREWVSAYRALSDLDDARLAADDFAALATTAYLLGRQNDCVQALQRAFQRHLDGDHPLGAVRAAFWLALVLIESGESAVGGGWVSRAGRILDERGGDVVERGYLQMTRLLLQVGAGEFDRAPATADTIVDYARRFSDPDLLAFGLNSQGRMLTYLGRVQEGVRLLDEAMVGVVAGEVSPIVAGMVYCSMVEACQWVSDLGRAGEWTRALTTWCERQPGLVAFTGQCAVHRGQLMRLRGAFREALDELDRAVQRYALLGGHPAQGLAHNERGEVLGVLGDEGGALAAYDLAVQHGHSAQPGRAQLDLARGDPGAAVAAVRRLARETLNPVDRNRLLPGVIDVLVAAGQVDEADELAGDLAAIAKSFGCTALAGAAGTALTQVAVARGDGAAALAAVRPAIVAWTSLSAEYEVARCRSLLGRALRLVGDDGSAVLELTAARDVFARVGARPALTATESLLGVATIPGGLSPREVEVLRRVAAGRSNSEIAAELVLSEKTVARHLSNIFTKLGVGSRTAAAAFAFEHRLA